MPQLSRVPEPGTNYVTTTFEELPSVQTYLVAFIIFDFTYVQDTTGRVPHRVFASPQSILDGEAALAIEVSGRILSMFEEYLGVNYTLPKMDQSVIPNFSSGSFMKLFVSRTFRKIFNHRCYGELGFGNLPRISFAVQ